MVQIRAFVAKRAMRFFGLVLTQIWLRQMRFDSDLTQISGQKNGGWSLWPQLRMIHFKFELSNVSSIVKFSYVKAVLGYCLLILNSWDSSMTYEEGRCRSDTAEQIHPQLFALHWIQWHWILWKKIHQNLLNVCAKIGFWEFCGQKGHFLGANQLRVDCPHPIC